LQDYIEESDDKEEEEWHGITMKKEKSLY
jgi:hypothetical protein